MRTRKCGLDKAHFVRSALSASVARSVRKQLLADFNRFTTADTHDANIYLAVSHILRNRTRLRSMGRNETEVRYVICDPVMNMVCDCFNYTLKMEESVKDTSEGESGVDDDDEAVLEDLYHLFNQQSDTDPALSSMLEEGRAESTAGRQSLGGAMSRASKADYSVYTVVDSHGTTKVVAILEAKQRITPHCIAQVIGYYSAFEISDPRPLVLIMTACELKIVFFPFKAGKEFLVNAVELESFPLWQGIPTAEGHSLSTQPHAGAVAIDVLKLLLSLLDEGSQFRAFTCDATQASIPEDGQFRKTTLGDIVITDTKKLAQVEHSLRQMKQTLSATTSEKELFRMQATAQAAHHRQREHEHSAALEDANERLRQCEHEHSAALEDANERLRQCEHENKHLRHELRGIGRERGREGERGEQ